MFLKIPRIGGKGDIRIIVGKKDEEDLRKKCFRKNCFNAGNFIYWDRPHAVFGDTTIIGERTLREHFTDDVEVGIAKNTVENSVCIDCIDPIGWTGVDDRARYPKTALAEFNPNRSSRALRIRPERRDILAPLTPLITIAYSLKPEGQDTYSAIIHSMYTGDDIGEILGDITAREHKILFDWNHPGIRL
jgi:hypothetical protein